MTRIARTWCGSPRTGPGTSIGGPRFDALSTVLIGDTPSDIAAAHDGGAGIIAVATGKSTVAELRHGGADIVLPGLTDDAAILQAVMNTV